MRNEKLVIFDEGGFLINHAMGVLETEEELRFFMAENEQVDAFALTCMEDLEAELDADFVGVTLETDPEKIVVDEFFQTNCLVGGEIVGECMVAVFRKW